MSVASEYGEVRPFPRKVAPPTGLPIIKIIGGEIDRVVDETEQLLLAAAIPIFVRAGELVRPVTEEMPSSHGHKATVARFRPLSADAAVDLLAGVVNYQRFDGRSKEWTTIDPPPKVASVLLAREGRWKLPHAVGVISTPTLRPDGSILSKPGYDPTTQLYLTPSDGLVLPRIPEMPTRADAEKALDKLRRLLSGFPFVSPVDRSVALSGILTTVVRGAVSVAPLHGIRASTPGSGKTFLVDIASLIATGRRCPVISAGKTEEETEKRLGGLLREACQIISIDNVNGELGGDTLCQVAERPMVRVRILGRSDVPEFECKATLFATGNNLTMIGDMMRRTVLCSLDAGVERPELRKFDFDPVATVLADRGGFIAAAMTIARAYKAAGSPAVVKEIGSYGEWSAMVRAPLVWLGEADPVASMDTVREEDPETAAVRELFAHWREQFSGNAAHTASNIVAMASMRSGDTELKTPEFYDLLERMAGDGRNISTKRLGRWLTRIKGRVFDGHKIGVLPNTKHGNRFFLAKEAPGGSGGVLEGFSDNPIPHTKSVSPSHDSSGGGAAETPNYPQTPRF